MPKAGRFDYPDAELDDCIERLRKVHSVSKEEFVKREIVADILGMKPKSGWFNTLIGAMAQYGIVEAREGGIRITELGKTILYGEPDEVAKSKAQAVRNIELFDELFRQYGSNPTDEQVRVFLRQKAYIDVTEVQSLSEKIGKLFKKVAIYLVPAKVVEEPSKAPTISGGEQRMGVEIREPVHDLTFGYGSVATSIGTIKIIDIETLDLARRLLDVIENRIKQEEKQSVEQVSGE